jgi:hypothetical protein
MPECRHIIIVVAPFTGRDTQEEWRPSYKGCMVDVPAPGGDEGRG